MAFLGVFWYQFKTQSKQIKYSGFVKLGVGWAERGTSLDEWTNF